MGRLHYLALILKDECPSRPPAGGIGMPAFCLPIYISLNSNSRTKTDNTTTSLDLMGSVTSSLTMFI